MSKYYKKYSNSNRLQVSIKRAEQEAKYLNDDLTEKIVKFVYECREKNTFPEASKNLKSYLINKRLLKPIPFCTFVYNVFDNNCCTVSKFALNKAYQILSQRNHNNSAPHYIFEHYNCIWTECCITFFGFRAVKIGRAHV